MAAGPLSNVQPDLQAGTVELNGQLGIEFSVDGRGWEMSPWLLKGPQVTLREDMDVGLIGVGAVCEDGFWHIFPADYEPSFN